MTLIEENESEVKLEGILELYIHLFTTKDVFPPRMSPLSLREELVWHLKVNIPSVSSLTYCQPSCSLNGLTYYGMLGSADTLRPTHRTQGLEPVGLLFWQCCLVNNGSEAGWKSHCCGGMGSYLLRVTSPLVPCQRLESFIISLQVFGLS